jgi:hypothetical protein
MRDLLRLVFLAFVNDDSDTASSRPSPSPSSSPPSSSSSSPAEGAAGGDGGSDVALEEIQSESERKGFHYLNDVQVRMIYFYASLFKLAFLISLYQFLKSGVENR